MTASPKMDDDRTTREQAIREAVARGWCDPANSHKEMDAILAESIVREVCALESSSEVLYTKADMEAACEVVLAGFRSKPMLDKMVDRFLSWPLPFSVCADPIATKQSEGRVGTNLLTAIEARQMLEHVLSPRAEPGAPLPTCDCTRYNGGQCYNCLNGAHYICSDGHGRCSYRAEHEPNAAEQERIETAGTTSETGLGQTKPASAAPEQTDEQRIKTALLALRCPDPERARPDAMQPDMTDYDRGLRDGRARGFAEGLEEAAKVCDQKCAESSVEMFKVAMRLASVAIRAKIKPTRGET